MKKLLYTLGILATLAVPTLAHAIVPVDRVEVTPGTASAWTDVDVTSYVGSDAGSVAGVMLHVVNTNTSPSGEADHGYRKNGSTDTITGTMEDGGQTMIAVGVDSSDIFEANIADITDIDVYLVGYFKTNEATFFTNAVDKSITATSTWTDVDISSDTGGETASVAFLHMYYALSGDPGWGLRQNGSSADTSQPAVDTGGFVDVRGAFVGVDGSEIFEYISNEDGAVEQQVWLVGYATDNATWIDPPVERSTVTTGEYTSTFMTSQIPDGANGALVWWDMNGTETETDLRKAGSTDEYYFDVTQQQYMWLDVGGLRQTEQKIGTISADLHVVGYTHEDGFAESGTALPTNVASTTATFNGDLYMHSATADIGFEYGIDGFTATTTVQTGTTTQGAFSHDATGLTAFEEYFVRAFASTTDGVVRGNTYKLYTSNIAKKTEISSSDANQHASFAQSDFNDGTHATTTGITSLELEPQGVTSWTLVGATTTSIAGDGSDTAVTLPGSPQEDDIVLVAGVSDLDTAPEVTGVDSAGYTLIYQDTGSSPDTRVQYKVMGATPDTTVTLSTSGYTQGRDANYVIQVWRGVDTANPIDVTSTNSSGTSGDPDSPSITTTTNGALVFSFGLLDDDDVVGSPTLSGYTNVSAQDTQFGAAGSSVMVASKEVATAGAEDPPAWVTTGDDAWKAVTVALRKSGGSGSYEDGVWTSDSWNVGSITSVGSSHIEFNTTTPSDTAVRVKVAVNSSDSTPPSAGSFTTVTNGGSMSGAGVTGDLSGKYLWVRVELDASTDTNSTPTLENLVLAIEGEEGETLRRIIII